MIGFWLLERDDGAVVCRIEGVQRLEECNNVRFNAQQEDNILYNRMGCGVRPPEEKLLALILVQMVCWHKKTISTNGLVVPSSYWYKQIIGTINLVVQSTQWYQEVIGANR